MVVDGPEGSPGAGLSDPWLDHVEEQPAKKQLDGDTGRSVVLMDAGGCVGIFMLCCPFSVLHVDWIVSRKYLWCTCSF